MKPLDACYYLDNKTFHCGPDPRDRERPLATPCWCLKTHAPAGPDGREVNLQACAPGRRCYRPEVQL
jgi:hypothetical protein